MDENMEVMATETPIPFMQCEVGAYLRSAIKNWETYRDSLSEDEDTHERMKCHGAIEALEAVQEALFGSQL